MHRIRTALISDFPNNFLTCGASRNIYWPSRSGQRGAPVSSSAQERDATDPSRLWAFRAGACREARLLQSSERTMTRRRGGRPKDPAMRRCPAFSQGARRRGAAGSCKPVKTVACGTQALPASEAAVCRVLFQQHTVSCAWKAHDATWSPTWRRGRGETPCVPHAPSGEMRKAIEFEDRHALGPD